MDYLAQNAATHRHIFPDIVRAFALLGIVVVNVAFFAYPFPELYGYAGAMSAADEAAYFVVNAFFLGKSYSLFSIMFGAGLAYQMASAERAGAQLSTRYFRRMAGLAVLGLLHMFFAFSGDILLVYAALGCVLYLFKDVSPKYLRRWAYWLLGVLAVLMLLFGGLFALIEGVTPEAMDEITGPMREMADESAAIYRDGNLVGLGVHRLQAGLELFATLIIIQGVAILAYFLFGLSLVKTGALQDPDRAVWRRSRRVFLPIGLAINLLGAWVMYGGSGMQMSADAFLGQALVIAGAPFLTFGYLGWLAKWAGGPATPFKIFMARAGTSSLTAYLLQSLILSLVFSGYGLGLYAELGAAACIAIAFATGVVSIVFSSLWRKRRARGPVESLLRRWTYAKDAPKVSA